MAWKVTPQLAAEVRGLGRNLSQVVDVHIQIVESRRLRTLSVPDAKMVKGPELVCGCAPCRTPALATPFPIGVLA